MNTNTLKRFAREARIKLLEQVGHKLEFVLSHATAELRGKEKEIAQLTQQIQIHGKEQVIETVAYTWFNRLMALRFMDANGYTLPKVVTPLPGMTNPEILKSALSGDIDPELPIDRQRLNELLDGKTQVADAHTEAYKLLLVATCNYWNRAMPFMFERISDYTELLLPDNLLSEFSIVADIRNGMSDDDCRQEEVLGWLYQFYIADKKDEVFADLKKNKKITAENIPAATQLFTPRWIVRYMVENTLGKLWLTIKPHSRLKEHMPYYIEAPEGNSPVPVPEGIHTITDITFLDPCMGSGHVLVYAFELFARIYEEEGYNTHEIPALILQHNLFGMDIDERATQLAAFALTMKAQAYYSRFLRKPVLPHVIALENISDEIIQQSIRLPLRINGKKIENHTDLSLHLLTQADNFGSLIQIDPQEVPAIQIQQGGLWKEPQQKLKEQAEYLSRQYHCVVTNPPYMGGGGMNATIKAFVEKRYKKSKSDLMACFMERCLSFNQSNGKSALINQHSWMFLSSYAELRLWLMEQSQIESMLHLGPRTFPEIGGEVVQNTAFVLGNYPPQGKGTFVRLTDHENAQLKEDKTLEAIQNPNCGWFYTASQKDFEKIPGSPVGYWVSQKISGLFSQHPSLMKLGECKQGLSTADNNQFIRLWFEVDYRKSAQNNISISTKWFPFNKGGSRKKWYGNQEYLINWSENGRDLKHFKGAAVRNEGYYFRESISWGLIASSEISFRYYPAGFIFDAAGSSYFPSKSIYHALGTLNTKAFKLLTNILNPTLNLSNGVVSLLPFLEVPKEEFIVYVKQNIAISRLDWNSRETSWDFQQNELVKQQQNQLSAAFETYKTYWSEKFFELHRNEEELNRIFIDIYGLQEELTPDVPLEEITILQEEAKIINDELFIDPVPVMQQFISYSVGCMLGRYSLDKPGLILANQGETLADYLKKVFEASAPGNGVFLPDEDNIIPVLEGEWFVDDIVGRFREFLRVAFGEEYFAENLKFIEDTLGKDIRKYFVKDFYPDHIKRYKKRPIYWMFSSPKGHFKALIYMHRYQPDLCSKLLNDYLQAFISKLEAARHTQNMFSVRVDITPREKTMAQKEVDKFDEMLKDCRNYEKTLFTAATQRISIDLDDGVKVNYQKFNGLLVPIKGLEKVEE